MQLFIGQPCPLTMFPYVLSFAYLFCFHLLRAVAVLTFNRLIRYTLLLLMAHILHAHLVLTNVSSTYLNQWLYIVVLVHYLLFNIYFLLHLYLFYFTVLSVTVFSYIFMFFSLLCLLGATVMKQPRDK